MNLIKEVKSATVENRTSDDPNVFSKVNGEVLDSKTQKLFRRPYTKVYSEKRENPSEDFSKIINTLENIIEEIRRDWDSPHSVAAVKEISDLNISYKVGFSKISSELENWAAQRRMIIKELGRMEIHLQRTKTISNQCKIAFSSLDIVGTILALILERYKSDVTSQVLFAGGTFGLLSLVSNLVEISKIQSAMKHILKEFRKDNEAMRTIQQLFQTMGDFDHAVQKLFPHGINLQIAMMIHDPTKARVIHQEEFYKKLNSLSNSKTSLQITLAIVLTNIKKDPRVLQDRDFLTKVRVFSQSPIAEKWWNRIKYHGLLPISHKYKSFAELGRFSKVDSMPIPPVSMLSTSMWQTNGWATIGSLFLNSLVILEAYSDLMEEKAKEVVTLQELKRNLEKEYVGIMEVYDDLSPQVD